MSVAPPQPPQLDVPDQAPRADGAPGSDAHELEALIEEARRRTRRRRRRYAWAIAAAAAVAVAGLAVAGGREDAPTLLHVPAPHDLVAPPPTPAMANGSLVVVAGGLAGGVAGGYGERTGWYGLSVVASCADGLCLRPLVRCPGGVEWCGNVVSFAVSPDGTRLALSIDTLGAEPTWNGLHVIDLRSRRDLQIDPCRDPSATGHCVPTDLAFSPDGTRLAYASHTYDTGNLVEGIYVIDADGSSERQPVPGTIGAAAPAWTPDGTRLVFATDGTYRESAVVRSRLDGSERVTLAASGHAPAISPDGSRIAFVADCRHLVVVWADGSDPVTTTLPTCELDVMGRLMWSPDGHTIAATNVGGVVAVDARSGHLRSLTDAVSEGFMVGLQAAAWLPVPATTP